MIKPYITVIPDSTGIFFPLPSLVFPFRTHSTDYLNEATLREEQTKKKPFPYQTEGRRLACIIVEVVKM